MSECEHKEWRVSNPPRYSFPTFSALSVIWECADGCGAETDGLFFPEPFPTDEGEGNAA